jgi:ATP-binding cassette subfamily B protein
MLLPKTRDSLADALIWPMQRTQEAMHCLAQHRGWLPKDASAPSQPDVTESTIEQHVDRTARRLGLEAEAVRATYGEANQLLHGAGPALLRLPNAGGTPRFVALLRSDWRWVYLIDIEHIVQRVERQTVINVMWRDLADPQRTRIKPLLIAAKVGASQRARTEHALLSEMIGPGVQRGGWLLRLPPGSSLRLQMLEARLPHQLSLLTLSYIAQLLLTVLAWWLIGRDALSGDFTWVRIWAWALVLLTTLPFLLLSSYAQRQVTLRIGEIFKVRLLQGALNLKPEAVRHQGTGAFLGRVLAADVVEQVTLVGSLITILSVLQLALAALILSLGTGGSLPALLLGMSALLILLSLHYGRSNQAYSEVHRAMTNDLVERMVGHRTRLAQDDPTHWHDEEDPLLERYVRLQTRVDQDEGHLSILPRSWIVVGLAGFVYSLATQQPDARQLAITLGGILLALSALTNMTTGMQSVFDVRNAWREVKDLFAAATQTNADPRLQTEVELPISRNGCDNLDVREAGAPPLLHADSVSFCYDDRTQPVLQDLNLRIDVGEQILLTGPSGGGKSTLAALLAGLRTPNSGRLSLWGHEENTVAVDDWRRRVVLVPQFHENYILTGTLAFNLLMGRDWPPINADLLEAEHICREVGLGDLIDRMPAGLEQMVGESGWRLSHGERSRVFVARALLQNPDLLILDESFGALDAANLQSTLASVRRRAETLMVIAHP